MKYILIIALLSPMFGLSQVENKIIQYTFNNSLGVGIQGANETSAYLQAGPTSGAKKGFQLGVMSDTTQLIGTPKRGLFIFNLSNNKPGYFDGTRFVYFGAGSQLTTVATSTDRDNIPSGDRYEGMIVYVSAEQKYYSLVGGTDNINWQEFKGSGGGAFIDNF